MVAPQPEKEASSVDCPTDYAAGTATSRGALLTARQTTPRGRPPTRGLCGLPLTCHLCHPEPKWLEPKWLRNFSSQPCLSSQLRWNGGVVAGGFAPSVPEPRQ